MFGFIRRAVKTFINGPENPEPDPWAQKHGYAGWNFDISKMELDPPKGGK